MQYLFQPVHPVHLAIVAVMRSVVKAAVERAIGQTGTTGPGAGDIMSGPGMEDTALLF